MSVMAKLCASVWALLLDREPEPRSWKDLHFAAQLGTACEHARSADNCGAEALGIGGSSVGKTRGCRGSWEDMPLFAASLNVNTAFDVAKLNVMANVLEETRGHGGLISAFQKEMRNLQGLAEFF